MAKSKNFTAGKILYSLMFLALASTLPVIEGKIGFALGLMGLFVLLCGFTCGAACGMVVGAVAPFLYSLLFKNGVIYPSDIILAVSLAATAFVGGLLYRRLDKSLLFYFVAAISAVICGALVEGALTIIFAFFNWIKADASITVFWSCLKNDYYVSLIHIVAVPLVVSVFRKNRLILN